MTTILLIEDNQDFRKGLLELLQLEGYDTVVAENGLTGLQILREHTLSLIICDVNMPVMNGLELLSIVKTEPLLAQIPFLILTASSDSQTQKKLYDLGAQAILSKPITVEELLSVIAQSLEQNPSV